MFRRWYGYGIGITAGEQSSRRGGGGGAVTPLPRQASLAPAVISIPAVSPALILVIQALPGEWGMVILVIGRICVPLCSCMVSGEAIFGVGRMYVPICCRCECGCAMCMYVCCAKV